MAVRSAGILLHRTRNGVVQMLIGHMGGPFWARKHAGAWSIPKGEHDDDEPAEDAARREFTEELGLPVPDGTLVSLGDARQSSGKIVRVFALAAGVTEIDPADVVPGTFELEWPPRSGRRERFPEIDRVRWCGLDEGQALLVKGQRVFVDRLRERLSDVTLDL